MCGGISLALGVPANHAPRRLPILYQVGRIASYGIGGCIVGAMGAAAGMGFENSRWSEVLRLSTAIVVVVIGLNIALGTREHTKWLRIPLHWVARLWRRISQIAGQRIPRQPVARALALGLLWGWLPCGLVYSALLVAAVAGSAVAGGAVMVAFGAGTLPVMLSLGHAGSRLPRSRLPTRNSVWVRLSGAILVACGLWTASMPIAALAGAHHHHAAHYAFSLSSIVIRTNCANDPALIFSITRAR
jgi:sulfite exporter TauE/SafE